MPPSNLIVNEGPPDPEEEEENRNAPDMWNEYALSENADRDGEPRSRRQKHVDKAFRMLRRADIAGMPVEMACEVQIATTSTVSVRSPLFSNLFSLFLNNPPNERGNY